MSKKKALVTGITGQDGAYLSALLLSEGYEVYGGMRRGSTDSSWRLKELGVWNRINPVSLEMLEYSNIYETIKQIQPDEVYNLAAQSFVRASFDQPIYTSEATALGPLKMLEAIKTINPEIKFYQASSSEMYGLVQEPVQNEDTKFYPRSPYAVAKTYAHYMTVNYRESYNIFGCCGILFNHESPLRGEEFVTRKITSHLARMKSGENIVLELGNFKAKRDWGYADDFVRAMYLMMQHETPDDYVIATGEEHTVEEFLTMTADILEMPIVIEGEGLDTVAIRKSDNTVIAKVNPTHFRPTEVELLLGNASKAKKQLGWNHEMNFEGLVDLMVRKDFDKARKKWWG